jgi:hypothetical protein
MKPKLVAILLVAAASLANAHARQPTSAAALPAPNWREARLKAAIEAELKALKDNTFAPAVGDVIAAHGPIKRGDQIVEYPIKHVHTGVLHGDLTPTSIWGAKVILPDNSYLYRTNYRTGGYATPDTFGSPGAARVRSPNPERLSTRGA